MTGEEIHELGRTGARKAKKWLEATTRANVHWVNPSWAAKLEFDWADGNKFSFDLGGVLLGDSLEGKTFLAESKYYTKPGDQPSEYRAYLARCYRTLQMR